MAANSNFKSKLRVCTVQAAPQFNTHYLFDSSYIENGDSAIDEFLKRLQSINKLAPPPNSFDPLQGQLILLGVIAAVESYLRTLFRRLITVDSVCREAVYSSDVSFGAAIHLSKEMLPEAILERVSFIGRDSIKSAIKDFVAIKGHLPSDVDAAISDYVKICQLRHCAVHRFGKLGASNAISLGLSDHKELIEKPLRLDYVALQGAISISTALVKTLNNFIFNEVVSRIPPTSWKGLYRSDKRLFGQYYSIFADSISSVGAAVDIKALYTEFKAQRSKFSANQPY
ncbi:hypothetical protein [Pseudomonas sp.]|uniref:hypothetical protein n=1 Tax=Pseudomonas sp. TaxID=306 RepID=UPI0031D330AF